MKKLMFIGALASLTACMGPVNPTTTKEMPTGYLCEILGPGHYLLESERRAAYGELELRGADCINPIGIKIM